MRARDDNPRRPYAFIQWKGTDVCMDAYCLCGEQFHLDVDFAYHIRCRACGQVYETGWYVSLYPLSEAETAEVEDRVKEDPEQDVTTS